MMKTKCTLLQLADIFTDHMVLQRDMPIRVFGEGQEGLQFTVELNNISVKGTVEHGSFKVELPPLPAGGPYTLVLTPDGGDPHVLEDILVGEVWLAGGQSNMSYSLQESMDAACPGAQQAIIDSYNPDIRWYDVPRRAFEGDTKEPDTEWRISSPESSAEFSAVAQYFARELHDSLEVPIGIIGCNWGGTPAEAWMSTEAQSKRPSLSASLEAYEKVIQTLVPEEYEAAYERYAAQDKAYRDAGGPDNTQGLTDPYPPPVGPKFPNRPGGLYKTMLLKTVPYSLRGALWYQGESNAGTGSSFAYRELLPALIQNWRELWQLGDFPFLLVQLPGFQMSDGKAPDTWPILRESQLETTHALPHVDMIVAIDQGERDDIHPRDKSVVGQRLARLAEERVYGLPVSSQGPEAVHLSRTGHLSFIRADPGIELRGDAGFAWHLEDGSDLPATPQPLEGKSHQNGPRALLSLGPIPENAVELRYAWADVPEFCLYGSNGIPVSPFRLPVGSTENEKDCGR